MTITVKPVSTAADKLVSRAQAASGEYAERAAQSGEKFAANAAAAKGNYGQAITAGGIPDRWARGIAKTGAQGYVNGIMQKGRDRFSQGVTVGKTKYAANVEPYFSTLASLTLSARQPRGSAANYGRVQEVGRALNAKRLAILGVGG